MYQSVVPPSVVMYLLLKSGPDWMVDVYQQLLLLPPSAGPLQGQWPMGEGWKAMEDWSAPPLSDLG